MISDGRKKSLHFQSDSNPEMQDQEGYINPTNPQLVNNARNFNPLSTQYPYQSDIETSSNLNTLGFLSFRSSIKDINNQTGKDLQGRKSDIQSQVTHHVNLSQFPQTKQQATDFFTNYQPKLDDFNKEALQNDTYYTERQTKNNIYYGQSINEKRHGKGIGIYYTIGLLINKNSRLYEGDWQSDLKHGKGFEIFPNGSYYSGSYINGKPEGVGIFEWKNSEVYEGQWMNGLKHGSGIWKGSKGDSYIGEWKIGGADGYGVHIWVNGDRYEGQFRNCLKTGQGQEKFANGDTYVGLYENGKPGGYGEYFWSNGSVYKGEFKNGLRHGFGVWSRGNGISEKYEGNFENDKKNGEGVFTWPDGNIYQGGYKNDLREGFGIMQWNDGTFYKGLWKNGVQDGPQELSNQNQNQIKGGKQIVSPLAKNLNDKSQNKNNLSTSQINDDNQVSKKVPSRVETSQDLHQNQKNLKKQNNMISNSSELQQQNLTLQLQEIYQKQCKLQVQQQDMQNKQELFQIQNQQILEGQKSLNFFANNNANRILSLQKLTPIEYNSKYDDANLSQYESMQKNKRNNSSFIDRTVSKQSARYTLDRYKKNYMDSFTQTQQFDYKVKDPQTTKKNEAKNNIIYPRINQVSPQNQNIFTNQLIKMDQKLANKPIKWSFMNDHSNSDVTQQGKQCAESQKIYGEKQNKEKKKNNRKNRFHKTQRDQSTKLLIDLEQLKKLTQQERFIEQQQQQQRRFLQELSSRSRSPVIVFNVQPKKKKLFKRVWVPSGIANHSESKHSFQL